MTEVTGVVTGGVDAHADSTRRLPSTSRAVCSGVGRSRRPLPGTRSCSWLEGFGEVGLVGVESTGADAAGLGALTPVSDVDTEVIGALTALGYSVVEAQAALQNIPKGQGKDVEDRIRLALQYFSTP